MKTGGALPKEILEFKGTWRPCQKRVLDRYQAYSRDRKFHIVAAPGAGKTTLGIELIRRINRPTLILVPSITIRQQWAERICGAFLKEPAQQESWLSQDLRHPKLITVATYQALHLAAVHFAGELRESEGGLSRTEQVDYRDFDLIDSFRSLGLGALCLDECHHLRNEWWKSLEKFKESLSQLYTVALTATPPYDSTPAQWERYLDMCGEIDEEITIPELVREGTLCPHQDYVYLNYPTDRERSRLAAFQKNAAEAFSSLRSSKELSRAVRSHRLFSGQTSLKELPAEPDYLISLVIYLRAQGLAQGPEYQRLLGPRVREPLSPKWLEILLQGFLYDDASSFSPAEGFRQELEKSLKVRGLIEKRKVMLRVSDRVERMLINSQAKCESIKTVTAHEYRQLGADLRLLILTDYIRREYEGALGDASRDVTSIGVLPIFEQLRRAAAASGSGLRLGVLCGSIVIIPVQARKALLELAPEPRRLSFSKAGGLTDYLKVEMAGDAHPLTGLVSRLFEQGQIQALIGTKSLLGEGWDAPCVNALIMASFVGSYMLSNQMRGRAIRIYRQAPDKTSNIWHLVCVKPQAAGAAGEEEAGEDYRLLCRRMDNFMGLNYREDVIESGVQRLTALKLPFSPANVQAANEEILALSGQRQALYAKWQRSLARYKNMEITAEARLAEEAVPAQALGHKLGQLLRRLLPLALILLAARQLGSGRGLLPGLLPGLGSLGILPAQAGRLLTKLCGAAAGLVLVTALPRLRRLKQPAGRLELYGRGIHKALLRAGLLEETSSRVAVTREKGAAALCLQGGTGRDRRLFARCVKEFFAAPDRQRYILYKRSRFSEAAGFFAVPEVFSRRKSDAQLFADCMQPLIGSYQAVYTGSETGRRLLLQGRGQAAAQRAEVSVRQKAREA